MSWAASSTVVSRGACSGSFVVHADTGEVVRSLPEAAARSTSRSVRMPDRKLPCMMRADPTRCRTMASAASATDSSGLAATRRVVIRSRRVSARRGASATLAYLVQLGVRKRRRRPGHFLRQQAPQRSGPRRDLRPPHPEQLQGGLVELDVRTLRRDLVGEVLELLDEFKEAVCVSFHVTTFGQATGTGTTGAGPRNRLVAPSAVIHTQESTQPKAAILRAGRPRSATSQAGHGGNSTGRPRVPTPRRCVCVPRAQPTAFMEYRPAGAMSCLSP